MASTITITAPHSLGVEEARKRVAERLAKLQRDYVSKVAHSEIAWEGDVADVRVVALGYQASARITVLADMLRIEVQLPWMLAALAGKVRELVARNADEALRIGHTPPKK